MQAVRSIDVNSWHYAKRTRSEGWRGCHKGQEACNGVNVRATGMVGRMADLHTQHLVD